MACTSLLAACGLGTPSAPTPPRPRDDISDAIPRDADEALEWLLEGNARFAEDHPWHAHEGARRRAALTHGQHPYAVVLGCADSRVPQELVFGAGRVRLLEPVPDSPR